MVLVLKQKRRQGWDSRVLQGRVKVIILCSSPVLFFVGSTLFLFVADCLSFFLFFS